MVQVGPRAATSAATQTPDAPPAAPHPEYSPAEADGEAIGRSETERSVRAGTPARPRTVFFPGSAPQFWRLRLDNPTARDYSYRFVHHLVSEVCVQLREGLGPVDLLRAALPGGSVTGAPKIRAMEIIAELEPTARGAYCGSLGYLGFDGSMDTSILIRTFTAGRGWLQFPVGGGIVADSVPEREYEETWDKAEGLLRALS